MFSNINIFEVIQIVIIIFVSIGFHEFAHAIVSYKLWDLTPKLQWRVTLNPVSHIDPIWWILILFMILTWWWIGRWKPVEINPSNYKNPAKWEFLVAIAWPAMNILLATISILFIFIYAKLSWFDLINSYSWDRFSNFFLTFAVVNLWLAVFNLIPIWPLDGFSIVKIFSFKLAHKMMEYRNIISVIVLILILGPTWNWFLNALSTIRYFLFDIIFSFFSAIFY